MACSAAPPPAVLDYGAGAKWRGISRRPGHAPDVPIVSSIAGEMLIDDLVQFPPESALFEMSSNSANAFPAMSSAVFVLPRSRVSLSFFALSF